jgi:hypothetical protein
MLVQEETDGPHLSWLQRSLRANLAARIPRLALACSRIKFRHSHDLSPVA